MKLAVLVASAIALAALPGIANAADRLPLPPPVAPVPTGNWAGSYLGVHAGYLWGDVSVTDGILTESNASVDGFIGGVLGGHNWQYGAFVFGIDLDAGWSNAHGTGRINPEPNQYDIDWDAHIRGRLGFEPLPGILVYGAAGVAFTHLKFTEGVQLIAGGAFTGATAGAGLEFMWTRNIIGRVEWLHDFQGGTKSYDEYDLTFNHADIARGALIYKFR